MKKCYTPVKKVCDGTGPEICKTVYESSCTTKYIDKSQNGTAFVGDTQCEKLPVKICGQGCQTFFADEECHDKEVSIGAGSCALMTIGQFQEFFIIIVKIFYFFKTKMSKNDLAA